MGSMSASRSARQPSCAPYRGVRGGAGLVLASLVLVSHPACTRTEVVVTGADGGHCTDAGCDCPPGTEPCRGRCVDLRSDPAHCGQCDRACGALEECRESTCECVPGAERCGGGLCRDLQRDPNHCGACDAGCEGGETCLSGDCVCRAGLARCGDDCVDTSSSAEHCGGCEHRCSEDPSGEYCWEGECTAVSCEQISPSAEGCGSSDRDCVPAAELAWNPLHCGECDERCDAEEVCTQGMCQAWFAPVACSACPCAECGQNLCCPYPGTAEPVCVVGAQACPPTP